MADDHAVVRAGIRQFLEHAGDIEVIAEASTGAEARRMIAELSPDIAVLDIQMPEGSGIDTLKWLREKNLPVETLILTAYDDDPYIMAALEAGANGFVLKTAEPAEIIKAVRDIHGGESALDPTVARKLLTKMSKKDKSTEIEPLTEREIEVLKLAGQGSTNKMIAADLGISDRTVQGHLARIYQKLNASSRTEAVMRAVSLGWLPSDLIEN